MIRRRLAAARPRFTLQSVCTPDAQRAQHAPMVSTDLPPSLPARQFQHLRQHLRPRLGWRLSVPLLLGLSACASPPALQEQAAAQAATSAQAALASAGAQASASSPAGTQWLRANNLSPQAPDGAALASWWQQLDDADLNFLLREALAHNSDLRIAQATLRQAQAARAVVEAGARPQLGSSASATRSRTGSASSSLYKLGLSASWEPDWSGSQTANLAAAEASAQAAAADLATTRMSLTAEVGIAYVQWRDALTRERITQASASSLNDGLALTTWRAQAGLDSALALEQARLALAQTVASLPSVRAEVEQYEHQLALLTGLGVEAMLGQLARQASTPDAGKALQQLQLGVPADLLRRRPDVRAAEASVRAQWATRRQTEREGWPTATLSGSLGLQALTLAALGSGGTGVAALAAGINWNLWDGGQRHALVAQQDALLEAKQIGYEAAVRSALKDVEDALVSLRSQHERTAALSQAAQAADGVLQLSQQQRQAGLLSLADVLSAQRSALSADLSLQSARTERTLALIRLFKALGGGWQAQAEPAADVAKTAAPAASTGVQAPMPTPPASASAS